ncbi:hypothetical protein BH09MYX1_BH09MYX1_54300 [soil metagenome]
MASMLRLGLWSALFVGTVSVAGAACVGERDVPVQSTDAGSDAVANVDADDPFDAGTEQEGGEITDGGGNPDETEAGVLDAGSEAGACGPSASLVPTLSSSCSSSFAVAGGGSIGTLTYHLTSYTVFGSSSYCVLFKPATLSGKLVVRKNLDGSYHFDERVLQSNAIYSPPVPGPNKSFTVTASGTTLTTLQICGVKVSDTSWSYTASGTKNARTLSYTRTIGSASVRLAWLQD